MQCSPLTCGQRAPAPVVPHLAGDAAVAVSTMHGCQGYPTPGNAKYFIYLFINLYRADP